jgi:hypothetical protein
MRSNTTGVDPAVIKSERPSPPQLHHHCTCRHRHESREDDPSHAQLHQSHRCAITNVRVAQSSIV